jgi:hypothetical protein
MRRYFGPCAAIGLICGSVVSAAAPRVNLSLVDYYSPQREAKLFAADDPVLAMYRNHGREFAFAGVVHSSDSASPTFQMIERAFTTVRPKAVLLEGFPTSWGANPARVMKKIAAATPDSSYEIGEDMYAARLASESGAAVWGSEPDDAELASGLRRLGFKDRDIFFASMFGPLAQDLEAKVFKGPDDPAFAPAYAKWAMENAKAYDPSAPTDATAFEQWFRQTYGHALTDDPQWFTRGGPGQKGIAGAIGRASNRIRDQHMFVTAMRLLGSDQRVLLVAGRSHLSSQWRAWQAALGTPKITFEK